MTEKQKRVGAVSAVFPGYDATLDSKCNSPHYYGIQRTPMANALIKKRKHKKCYYLSRRLSKAQEHELREAVKATYNMEPTEWLAKIVFDTIEAYKKSRPAADTDQAAKDLNAPQI